MSAGEDGVPQQLQAALAAVEVDAQVVQGGGIPVGQFNPQLRKRVYSEAEIAARKRNRRDVRATVEGEDAAAE